MPANALEWILLVCAIVGLVLMAVGAFTDVPSMLPIALTGFGGCGLLLARSRADNS